jgi:hypothetical protein
MKTLIIPPADTPLSFVVALGDTRGRMMTQADRKNTAAEALKLARDMASAGSDVRVMQEIAFTVDPGAAVHHGTAGESPVARPDVRDVLIRRLVNFVNKAGIEVLAERMPSLIEIAELMIEARALGYVPTGSTAEPIKYPDSEIGRLLKKQHENEREELRRRQQAERSEAT